MSAKGERRALDKYLARYGQRVELQRPNGPNGVPISITIGAHIVDFKPQEVIGGNGLQTGDSRVIISTTTLNNAQWPSPLESRLPRKGDRIIVSGRARTVLFAWEAPRMEDELIRIEMAVR